MTIAFKIEDLLNSNLSFDWPLGNLAGYQARYAYLLEHLPKLTPDAPLFYHRGIILDYLIDAGNPDFPRPILNPLNQQLDLTDFLNHPPDIPFSMDIANCCFSPTVKSLAHESRVYSTGFPYSLSDPDYLEGMTSAKRNQTKRALRQEGDPDIYPADVDDEFVQFYHKRLLELNDLTDRSETAVIESLADLKLVQACANRLAFKIYPKGSDRNSNSLCGIALYVETDPGIINVPVWNSTEPCVYSFVQCLHHFLPKGTCFHFGGAEGESALAYKYRVANCPPAASPWILGAREIKDCVKPFFNLNNSQWEI